MPPLQLAPDHRFQLEQVFGLGQDVIGPQAQAADAFVQHLAGDRKDDHDDPREGFVVAYCLEHLITIHTGHTDIQNQSIRPLTARHAQTVATGMRLQNPAAQRLEPVGQLFTKIGVVVDHEDRCTFHVVWLLLFSAAGYAPNGIGGHAVGRVTMNVAPVPGVLTTPISPWCTCTNSWQM